MSEPPEPAPPARRRWSRPRLSLRALLVVILLVGGALGWYVNRVQVQRDAVAAIRAAGGKVFYDYEWDETDYAPAGSTSLWPARLVAWLGPDFFDRVAAVRAEARVKGQPFDDAVMEQVGRLGRLQYLDVGMDTPVTDAGMVHLASLTDLRGLNFRGNTALDGGVTRHLAGLTRLQSLWLPNARITNADLAPLADLTDLRDLRSECLSPDLTDVGLIPLAGLIRLETLMIHSGSITSRGLESLGNLENLKVLDLQDCQVTDLAPLRGLTSLERLGLMRNPITDAGLAPLRDLPRLESLSLHETDVTDTGVAHLRDRTTLVLLELSKTRITDASLPILGSLTNLGYLNLDDTAVGDAHLRDLAPLGNLSHLWLERTRVTDAGLMTLAKLDGLTRIRQITVGGSTVTAEGVQAAHRIRPRFNDPLIPFP